MKKGSISYSGLVNIIKNKDTNSTSFLRCFNYKNMKKVFFALFLSIFMFCFVANAQATNNQQSTILKSGWNIVSTPRILSSHQFSVTQNSTNFDIYVADPTNSSGWQTMQGIGQTEFQPLYAYFINNKTGTDQTLTFNYNLDLNPSQRLFSRTLSHGWNIIGVASPNYALPQCQSSVDINNPNNILNSIIASVDSIVDFTSGNSSYYSPQVSTSWTLKTPADINSLNDFRELKGYGVYVSSSTATFNGYQNVDPIEPLSISKNASLSNMSIVSGQTSVKVGSYLIQNNSLANANIANISMKLSSSSSTAPNFINLTIKKNDGSVIGTSIASPSVGANGTYGLDNSFVASLNVSALSSEQIDVYLDTPSGITNGTLVSEIIFNDLPIIGQTATITALGTLTITKNAALGNSSKAAGQSNVRIGSFLLQASSTEGVNVSTVAVKVQTATDSGFTSAFGTAPSFANLTLKTSDSTVLGSSIGSPTVGNGASFGTANSFSVSGLLNIAASATVQVDVYMDLPTAMSGYLRTEIDALGISTAGASSGVAANGPATAQIAQTIQVVNGTLTITEETSGAASSQFLSTGLAGIELGKIKFAATVEDMKIDRLEVKTINGSGNLSQIKLLGTGLSTDPVASLTNGVAVFTFNSGSELTVPAYGSKVVTIAADTTNVGTLIPGSLVAVGFGTANAKGAGSGNVVEETVTGTNYVAGTNAYTGTVGDVIYFTAVAAGGNVNPGFYMVTTTGIGDLTLAGLTLNGAATATTWVAGDNVVQLTTATSGPASAVGSDLNVGDVVYIHDASTIANDGFYTVTSAVTGGSTVVTGANALVNGLTLANADRVTKITNANSLMSNTMQFEEVKPVIAKNASSPSGTASAGSNQIVAMFDVKADGSRDMTFSDFTVEKGGSNSPAQYVTHFTLYNGTSTSGTKIAEVANTSVVGSTTAGDAVAASTVTVMNAVSDAADKIGEISATEYAKWKVGDTLTITDGTTTNTVRIVTLPTYAAGGTAVVFSGTVTLAAAKTVSIYDNRIHFNAAQVDTGDLALGTQGITAGQTMNLTVAADTSSVKTGVTGGATANLTMSIPGTAGPLTVDTGTPNGLTWTYTKLNSLGSEHTGSTSYNYPVAADTLSY
jgi:hypothetical protein